MTAKEMASKLGVEVLDRRRRYVKALFLDLADEKNELAPKLQVYTIINGRRRCVGRMYRSELNYYGDFGEALYCAFQRVGGHRVNDFEYEGCKVIFSKELLQAFNSLKDDWMRDTKSKEAKLRRAYGDAVMEEAFMEDVLSGVYDNESSVRLW